MGGSEIKRLAATANVTAEIELDSGLGLYGYSGNVTVGEGAVWALAADESWRDFVLRVDPVTNEVVAAIPLDIDGSADDIAVGDGSAWVQEVDSTRGGEGPPDYPARFKTQLEKVPFRFRYVYRCESERGCPTHRQSIIDWEIGEAFRRFRDTYSGEQQAAKKIREKWAVQMWADDRDTFLYTGNNHENPDGFMILGVFWPKNLRAREAAQPPTTRAERPPRR